MLHVLRGLCDLQVFVRCGTVFCLLDYWPSPPVANLTEWKHQTKHHLGYDDETSDHILLFSNKEHLIPHSWKSEHDIKIGKIIDLEHMALLCQVFILMSGPALYMYSTWLATASIAISKVQSSCQKPLHLSMHCQATP